jgi:hypothetical protein
VAVVNPNNIVIASQPNITPNNSIETIETKEDASKEKKDTLVKPRSAITIFSQPSIETPKHSIDEVTANKITTKETAQTEINENTNPKNDEFLNILKMRLVKGEISKEEFMELREMINES